nr:MAG TPA: hypothetical protein [Bacteriophage sp.]
MIRFVVKYIYPYIFHSPLSFFIFINKTLNTVLPYPYYRT